MCGIDIEKIAVNHWGSHPDMDNDDCFTGDEFSTIDDAIAFYLQDPTDSSVEYIEIDLDDKILRAHGIVRFRKSGNFIPYNRNDNYNDEWKRELANEAGMLGGVDAYNDMMGYECGDPRDNEEYFDF
jgi:hypothetical protein